jgi:lipid II:glycine glycyltransferase (peptidoglycan interpeptide bridge formation enzyme)
MTEPARPSADGPLRLRTLDRAEHLAFLATRPSASFLQCPSWADVKAEWGSERLGWLDETGRVVGAALVLYRQIPRVPRYLAYVPEGPVVDWDRGPVQRWLDPLLAHLRTRRAFAVKMGPPVEVRRWDAATVKAALAAAKESGRSGARLAEVPADWTDEGALALGRALRAAGWRQEPAAGAGFGDVQPRYVFQLPLAGRGPDDLLKGFNQLWRRNIKKAEKAGVEVVRGDYADLAAFHELYRIAAARDRFTGRPLAYFQRMFRAMAAEDPDRIRLYLARHDGEVLAATLMTKVGDHVWYSYGASADHKREVRPSNAIQWRMIRDALEVGARVYDLRGISDTLDPTDHLHGLIQFKVGTGGQAVEYLGEWDYPLNRLLHRAFRLYLARR